VHAGKNSLIKFFWRRYDTRKSSYLLMSSRIIFRRSTAKPSSGARKREDEVGDGAALGSIIYMFSPSFRLPPLDNLLPQLLPSLALLHMNMAQQEAIKISNNLMETKLLEWQRCLVSQQSRKQATSVLNLSCASSFLRECSANRERAFGCVASELRACFVCVCEDFR
jgi:hypothetical protein